MKMYEDKDKGVLDMNEKYDYLVLDRPPVPAVTDHDYDKYDGFEFYPIVGMPLHFVDPETGILIKKKEIVYM